MIDYGSTRSTVRPEELEILETKVFVASDIKEISEDGTDEQPGFTGYEYNLVEFDKDEYIKLQTEKNKNLTQQLTDTQLGLTEVYEMVIG